MQTSKRRLFLGVGTSRAKDLRQKSWRDETTGAGEGVTRKISSQGLKIHGTRQGVFTLAVT